MYQKKSGHTWSDMIAGVCERVTVIFAVCVNKLHIQYVLPRIGRQKEL